MYLLLLLLKVIDADHDDTKFALKRQKITKEVSEYFKEQDTYNQEEVRDVIRKSQTLNKFHLWYFDSETDMSVYFPKNEVSESTYDDLMGTSEVPKYVFEDEESFLNFVAKEFTYTEILLSSDGMMDLYKKHLSNIEFMHEVARKQYNLSREAAKTKKRLVDRADKRVADEQSGSLNTSIQNIKKTANVQYLQECRV